MGNDDTGDLNGASEEEARAAEKGLERDISDQERRISIQEKTVRIRIEEAESKDQRSSRKMILVASIAVVFVVLAILGGMIFFSHNEFHQHVASHIIAVLIGAAGGRIWGTQSIN